MIMKRLLVFLLCISMLTSVAVLPEGAAENLAGHDEAATEDGDTPDEGDADEYPAEETLSDIEVKGDSDVAETGYNLLTEQEFQAKMAQMRKKYPDGDIWSGIYYEYGAYKADTCWGYACQMMYEFFGAMFYSDGIYSSYRDYSSSDICAGDWVRLDLYGGSSEGTHSIFITKVTDSGVYYTDGNGTGVYNQIRWDGYYSWSEFNSMFRWRVHLPGNNLKGRDAAFTIGYNGNGGSGSMSSETIAANGSFRLKSNGFSRSGYEFTGYTVCRSYDDKWYTTDAGWQTKSAIERYGYTYKVYPQGNSYTLGTPWIGGISVSCSFTFYAQWKAYYTIAYHSNGGSGSMASETIYANDGFTLDYSRFRLNGYSFGGYNVRRSSDNKWYTEDAGWQTLSDIYDKEYTFKVYPEGRSYVLGSPWIGGVDSACSFTFYAQWLPDKTTVEFLDNYSGYNYLLGSDLGPDFSRYIFSRNSSTYSLSVDSSERLNNASSLKIVGKQAGSEGCDLSVNTSTNIGWGNGYSQLCEAGDHEDYYLRFCAKSSVEGAKMYIRWGFSSVYETVTLSKGWKTYTVYLPKTKFYGAALHPYFDTAGTFYLNSLALGVDRTTNVVPETGRFTTDFMSIDRGGRIAKMPTPVRDGYTFDGWFTEAEYGERVTSDTVINAASLRLYAHWTKEVSRTPVKTFISNGHLYELYDNQMSWEDAESFCEDQGGHLATIDSNYENQVVYNMINDRQGYCWIGLSYNDYTKSWEWISGEWYIFSRWYKPAYATEDSGEYYAMMYPMNIGAAQYAATWDKCVGSSYRNSYYSYYNSFFVCEYDNIYYLGDVNGDNSVTITDATAIQRCVIGFDHPKVRNFEVSADVDGDYEITIVDATVIQRYVTNVHIPYPVGELQKGW